MSAVRHVKAADRAPTTAPDPVEAALAEVLTLQQRIETREEKQHRAGGHVSCRRCQKAGTQTQDVRARLTGIERKLRQIVEAAKARTEQAEVLVGTT